MSDQNRPDGSLSGRRILFVIGPLVLGGSERQVLLLARLLRERWDARVEVWATYEGGDQLVPFLDQAQIPWRMVHAPIVGARGTLRFRMRQLKRFVTLIRELRSSRFDAVLPFMGEPSIIVSLTRPFTRIRTYIWNQRFDGADIRHRGLLRLARIAARFATSFISNSEVGADFLRRDLGVNDAHIAVVHNGIVLADAQRDRGDWRDEIGASDDDIVGCMIANLHPPKDQATVIRAWKSVVEHCGSDRRAILVLAGRFVSSHVKLQSLARELGIHESVRFPGAVTDVSGLLDAVDIATFSSEREGMPNGLLECMAAGLAVVATDIPGVREALGDQSGEMLVPVGDATALSKKLINLIDDKAMRREIGARNRRRVESEFSAESTTDAFARIINESLSRNVGR